MNLSGIQSVLPVQPLSAPNEASSPAAGDFAGVLQTAVNHVESSGAQASKSMEQFISGENVDLHNVALSAQKAGLDFDMFLQVRNKIVQAYQEVMRLQL